MRIKFWRPRESAPASAGADTANTVRENAPQHVKSETTTTSDQHMMASIERREVSRHAAALGPIDKLSRHGLWKDAAALGAPNESLLPAARRLRR